MAIISIASAGPDRVALMRGTVPVNAAFKQYMPIVDDDGVRIDLTNYAFEITFRDNCGNVALRLSTVTGEITKTTDTEGDTLLISVAPSLMSGMCGPYASSFAAEDNTGIISTLAAGTVVFQDIPAAFA